MSRSIAEKSIETQLIEKRLLNTNEGDLVTYQELSDLVSGDVQYKLNSQMRTAIKNVRKEHGVLFSCCRNEGFKRITPSESVAVVKYKRQAIKRRAKQAKEWSASVDWSRLEPDEKQTLNAERTILAFIGNSAEDKQVAKIASAINGSGEALPAGKVLELFAKK